MSDFKNNIQSISVGIFKTGNKYRAEILPVETREEVIYTRSFSEMLFALGYCNVMNKLSKKSVERLITVKN
jgi:hypothetical protein